MIKKTSFGLLGTAFMLTIGQGFGTTQQPSGLVGEQTQATEDAPLPEVNPFEQELLEAARDGNLEIVQEIIESGKADVNCWLFLEGGSEEGIGLEDYHVPLSIAAQNGHTEIVRFLLSREGIEIYPDILSRAVWKGHTEVVQLLLSHPRVEIDPEVLAIASFYDYEEIVQLLLDWNRQNKKIDINYLTEKGGAFFLYADCNNNWMKVLNRTEINHELHHGAEPHTALSVASQKGHLGIVKLLLEQPDININCRDIWEATPLIYASYNGHTEIVQLLLSQPGIDVNCRDCWFGGNTALGYARQNGHQEIADLLSHANQS